MREERIRILRPGDNDGSPVLYWMSRDQRANDNWALLYAQSLAIESGVPLAVAFCLMPTFLDATIRQYSFMLDGLAEVRENLNAKGIPFFLLMGNPVREIPKFVRENGIGMIITDFDPLRIKREWQRAVAESVDVPVIEVDAHNIVPCRIASDKQEYAARTIRPKINKVMDKYLDDLPSLKKHPVRWSGAVPEIDWNGGLEGLKVDRTVGIVDGIRPGEKAARKVLREFILNRLDRYADESNDPNADAQSGLSPYIHFGQISAHRVAMEVMKSDGSRENVDAFLEQLIVRRELAENFCFYNPDYDNPKCFPDWARKTLDDHVNDEREYVYSMEELEEARTHDDLWNAAQMEMVVSGKMHGYMRMYWAKKILEWTPDYTTAMEIAIRLNDRYELDGRDPNGYAGIAWSIGGLHDQAWKEREIFGKVRYMNYAGARRKFDVDKYIARWCEFGREHAE